jgi:hypothetical protein
MKFSSFNYSVNSGKKEVQNSFSFWSGIMSNDQNRTARLLAGNSFLFYYALSVRSGPDQLRAGSLSIGY